MLQLFDYDQDGVVNMKEGMGMLKCLGLPVDEPNVSDWNGRIEQKTIFRCRTW